MTLLLLSWACSSNPDAPAAPSVPPCEPFQSVLGDQVMFRRRVACSTISMSVEHDDYATAEPQWRRWLQVRDVSVTHDDTRPGFTQVTFDDAQLGHVFLSVVEQPARATATLTVLP